jgi:hypothetical protein
VVSIAAAKNLHHILPRNHARIPALAEDKLGGGRILQIVFASLVVFSFKRRELACAQSALFFTVVSSLGGTFMSRLKSANS